jgi:hypothetical protein
MHATSLKQTFLNEPSDCQWLRETHLADRNLNNALPFEFKSFCLFGNEDCPNEILIYQTAHASIYDKPWRAMLCSNSHYSLFKV